MSKPTYEKLNNFVMSIIYSPLLVVVAWIEKRNASTIIWNRRRGEADDDSVEVWEVLNWRPDAKGFTNGASAPHQGDQEWCRVVEETSPDPAKNPVLEEVRALRQEIEELRGRLTGAEGGRREGQ